MHAYIYEMNILMDLMYWSMYEMIILSESIDSLNIVIHWHSLNTDVPSSADLTCFAGTRHTICGFSSYSMACFPFSLAESKTGWDPCLFLKINMDKTSQKVIKDTRHVEAAALWALPAPLPPTLPALPPHYPVILVSMALAYLLYLPLVFVYFLHITVSRL